MKTLPKDVLDSPVEGVNLRPGPLHAQHASSGASGGIGLLAHGFAHVASCCLRAKDMFGLGSSRRLHERG
jgi:hypothetical protein